MVRLAGSLNNDAGEALASADVYFFLASANADESTSVTGIQSTTTNSAGVWAKTDITTGAWDVRIQSGTSVRWRRYEDEIQVARVNIGDNASGVSGVLALGNDSDIVMLNSAALSADATLSGVIESGGGVDHPGVTANSLIISNITDNGDIMFAVSDGGNSKGLLKLDGTNGKVLIHGVDTLSLNGTTLTSTGAELNILDGATVVVGEINYLDLGATAVGTAIASKAVILDSNKDYTGIRNLTITGELDGATLDLSSSADIAGDLVLSGGADGALQFTNAGENSIKIPDNQSSALIIEEADNAYITFNTTNSSEAITVAKATTFSSTIAAATGSTIGNLTLANGSITDSGGALDFGNETLTTTGAVDFGAATVDSLSVSDANITNVGNIALDSISADTTDINIAVTDDSATALTILQGSDAYLIIDTANSSESVSIGTGVANTAITLGHGTSETTVGQNLTITGNLTVNGTTTTVNSTTTTVDDPIITLGGDTAPGSDDNKDRGVEFRYHDGSSARIGFFGYDDSASIFTGFTAATNSSEVFSGTVMNATFGNIAGTLTTASQTNITAVGTIGTGVWEGTTVAVDQGGTGATSLSDLITLGTHTTGNYAATVANATNGGTTIANSGSETAAITVAVNLNDLSAAAVDVANDSIAIIDANASNGTRKESIADLATAMAGTNLTASSGQLVAAAGVGLGMVIALS